MLYSVFNIQQYFCNLKKKKKEKLDNFFVVIICLTALAVTVTTHFGEQ